MQAKGKASRSENGLPFIRDWGGAVLSLEFISALEKHLLLEEAIKNNKLKRTTNCGELCAHCYSGPGNSKWQLWLLSALELSKCLWCL